MKIKYFYPFLFLLFLINTHTISFAQTDSIDIYKLSIEELMNLEVDVASMVVKDYKKQPVSLISISSKQLEMSGARTLAEALSMLVPGMFLVEDQDDIIIGFRGLAPDNNSKVMLMVDGRNLNIEWFWGPPPAILNTSNFEFIERVEVIRGPGSVTLGQGALLGVINIVTQQKNDFSKGDDLLTGFAKASYGMNEYKGIQAEVSYQKDKSNGYFFVGTSNYQGQKLRNEGWANDKANEGYRGGFVKDIGTRLKRNSNSSLIGNFNYNNFSVSTLLVSHKHDLYNFYRDRNHFGEILFTIAPSFVHEFSSKLSLKILADVTLDDFALGSIDGYTMGGTRENRYGAKAVCNINEVFTGNKLAIGMEYRRYGFGRNNFKGNNFIGNMVTQDLIDNPEDYIRNANENKVWGYKSNINVYSLFAEDYQSFGSLVDFFAGIRYDFHPFWGSNLTPRLGAILSPTSNLRIRFSFQTGFRGAVGLHYGGGFREDGLLSEDNFMQIERAQIPVYNDDNVIVGFEENLPETKPESMQGLELAVDWDVTKKVNFYCIGFYNVITNVIDVGVIWRDPNAFPMVSVGSDLPGDWNGYWFFKNTSGRIEQGGFESGITFNYQKVFFNINHSLIRLISSSPQQRGSMYITQQNNFKAYPENVTRINAIVPIGNNISFGSSYLFYYSWYSPNDQTVNANHLLNLSLEYSLLKKLNVSLSCLNVLNQSKLYPMNSNVGDAELSDGTPSVENTSVWLTIGYDF